MSNETRDVAAFVNAPYIRMLIPDAREGGYLAEVLELPGCISEGDTLEEAYRNLQEAMEGWIATALDRKQPIPEPVGDREYSGHFPLRISTELHRAAALRAAQEAVSLNQWIAKAIAAQVAGENLAENLADKIAPKVAERISVEVSGGWKLELKGVTSGAPTPSDTVRAALGKAEMVDTGLDAPSIIASMLDVGSWQDKVARIEATRKRKVKDNA